MAVHAIEITVAEDVTTVRTTTDQIEEVVEKEVD